MDRLGFSHLDEEDRRKGEQDDEEGIFDGAVGLEVLLHGHFQFYAKGRIGEVLAIT